MRIAITGATGLLGRNFMFEVLKRALPDLQDLELVVLGRSRGQVSPRERIEQICMDDGMAYLDLPSSRRAWLQDRLREVLVPVEMNLADDDLGLTATARLDLTSRPLDLVVHCAAVTDLSPGITATSAVQQTNVDGTRRLLALLERCTVRQFVYVSSAYACGMQVGPVDPGYVNLDQAFRNPYERAKLQGEILTRRFAARTNTLCRICRPSTICGRLCEEPLGSSCKFDVFYAWAAFFAQQKLKLFGPRAALYDLPAEMNVRIHINPQAGLNIIPADYAAKLLYEVCTSEHDVDSFHLAHHQETPHLDYIRWMMQSLNIHGWQLVPEEPEGQNRLERLYYRSVGRVFTPYVTAPRLDFQMTNIRFAQSRLGFVCPTIDEDRFQALMNYAQSRQFGKPVAPGEYQGRKSLSGLQVA